MAVRTVQYVSQFDPAAEQLSQNVLRDKQARFDQAYAGLINEYARQGDVFSLDPEYKEKQMQQFRDKASEVIDKYNGDYGAASKELAALVAQERQNPFYNLNKMHIQKKAEEMALKNKYGADAIVLKGVPDSLEEVVNDPSKLDYEIYDRSKMNNKFLQITEDLVKPRVTAPKKIKGMEGYLAQDYEVTPEDIDNITQDEEDINMIMEAVPELARIAESQGLNPKSFIQKYARTMLSDRVGIYRRQYLQDNNYVPPTNEPSEPDVFTGETIPGMLKNRTVSTKVSDLLKEGQKLIGSDVKKVDETAQKVLSPGNLLIYEGIKEVGNTLSKYFIKSVTPFDIGLNDAVAGIEALINNGKIKKLDKAKKLIVDFQARHPEAGQFSLKQTAKAIDDIYEQYSKEFSTTHIPSREFNASESNFVFINKQGNIGNILGRKISTYDEEGNRVEILGEDKPDQFYELIAGKDADDLSLADKIAALKATGITGLTFTGTTPASLIGSTISGKPLEIENTTPAKEAGSTAWAAAEAIRTDNNSELLDDVGNKYGIYKDDNGFYVIPNQIKYVRDNFGIDHFRVNNMLDYNSNLDKFSATPIIVPYDENDVPILINDKDNEMYLSIDDIINATRNDMIERGYIKLKEQ
jgi:hypothetical protein